MPRSKEKIFEIDEHIGKRFDIQKRLGKGAYGIVWKAIDRKTKEVVAVKKIFDAFRNQTDAQRTFREIMFLQLLKNHPNIVKLHSIHRAGNNSDIYLGFEYMETDLHNVIKRRILKEIHKKYIMYQLLKAVKYIHSANVIHRDLKPSNVLLDINCRCKIADFGLARSLTQSNDGSFGDTDPTLTDYVATRWYRAPEILISNRRYTKGIDMWSLGCILAEMIAGKPIFPGTSTVNQVEKIMATIPTPTPEDINKICVSGVGSSMIKNASNVSEKIPLSVLTGKCSEDALCLIRQLLIFNPNRRLTAKEALEHDYVSTFHDPEKEIIIERDIKIPFSDDVQFSVEDYRNKLYELMVSSHFNHKSPVAHKNKFHETYPRVMKNTEKYIKTHAHVIQSEPKMMNKWYGSVSTIATNAKSDSKVIRPKTEYKTQKLVVPKPVKVHNNTNIIHTNTNNSTNNNKETLNKRRICNTRTNLYSSYNSYNRNHGVITQSALMELKASGLR